MSIDAEPGECLAARINERSVRVLASQVVDRQDVGKSFSQVHGVDSAPGGNRAAQHEVQMRTAEDLLQVRGLPLAQDLRIGQAVASLRPLRQSRFTFSDGRTVAIVNPELPDEVEREGPDPRARQYRCNDSSDTVSIIGCFDDHWHVATGTLYDWSRASEHLAD